MIDFINSWAKGIILAVIIATIIEIILPEGNNKKYVKTIIGIYMLFVIVYPLITKISNKNINLESIIENTNNKMSEYKTNSIELQTNTYIEETYKQKLEDDISKKINEKGYSINSLDINIKTQNDETYGEINSIYMQIYKTEQNNENHTENTINNIENVEVKISNTVKNETKKESISADDIKNIKEYISTTYMIEAEKIHINE